MTVILAFSAHLDDAIFSAGGTLARAVHEGARVIVATLFAGNVAHPQGFALQCQTDKGLSSSIDYMALRREEDRAACAIIGAEAWHCALLEAPHRGYNDAKALFRPPREDDGMTVLRDTLRYVLAHARPDVVWAPRALGSHVDHVLLHRTLRSHPSQARIFWYSDFPYSTKSRAPDLETPKLGSIVRLSVDLTPAMKHAKTRACGAYATQLGFQFGGQALMQQAISLQRREVFACAPC